MYPILMSFMFFILSTFTSAQTAHLICKAENVQDPVNKFGQVKITYEPLSVTWTNPNGSRKEFFGENIVCGRDISQSQFKPVCKLFDQSKNLLFFNLMCETQYEDGSRQWFAIGNLTVSEETRSGKFDCRTKYGSNLSVKLNLTDCK